MVVTALIMEHSAVHIAMKHNITTGRTDEKRNNNTADVSTFIMQSIGQPLDVPLKIAHDFLGFVLYLYRGLFACFKFSVVLD